MGKWNRVFEMPDLQEARAARATSHTGAAPWVDAQVNYLADLSVKPVTYNPPPGTGVPRRDGNYRNFTVRVHNARLQSGDLSLDRQAFILVPHETAVRDFFDEREVRGAYYWEVEALVKRQTGAAKVVVFDHTVRTAERAVERGYRSPVQSVH